VSYDLEMMHKEDVAPFQALALFPIEVTRKPAEILMTVAVLVEIRTS
jgi:hypothetical protein